MPDRAETLCHYALLRASCSARIVNKKLCEARASGRPKSCGNVAVSHLRLPTTWVQMAVPARRSETRRVGTLNAR